MHLFAENRQSNIIQNLTTRCRVGQPSSNVKRDVNRNLNVKTKRNLCTHVNVDLNCWISCRALVRREGSQCAHCRKASSASLIFPKARKQSACARHACPTNAPQSGGGGGGILVDADVPAFAEAIANASEASDKASSIMLFSKRTCERRMCARMFAFDVWRSGSFCKTDTTDERHRSFSWNVVAARQSKWIKKKWNKKKTHKHNWRESRWVFNTVVDLELPLRSTKEFQESSFTQGNSLNNLLLAPNSTASVTAQKTDWRL